MPRARQGLLRLNDGPLLYRLMRCPEEGGVQHTVRSLAEASGVSKAKIGQLIRGGRPTVSDEVAARIAVGVDVSVEALFTRI